MLKKKTAIKLLSLKLSSLSPSQLDGDKIIQLSKNRQWRPDITGAHQRLIAAAIHFTVCGKATRKSFVNSYIKRGFPSTHNHCRERLVNFGLWPKEYTDSEAAYHAAEKEKYEQKQHKIIKAEVEEEIIEDKYICEYNRGQAEAAKAEGE